MLDSIRVRLTIWYTLVLGLVLVLLTVFSYVLYGRSLSQRTDSNLAELANAFAATFEAELLDQTEANGVRQAGLVAMAEHRFRDTVMVILDSSGRVLESSLDLPRTDSSRERIKPELLASNSFRDMAAKSGSHSGVLGTMRDRKDSLRIFARPLNVAGASYTLLVLQSLQAQRGMLGDIRETFYWAIPLAVALASFGGYFLARKSLLPVATMASQARRMGAANLHDRLEVANQRDELGQLALSFNQLLERLESSFEQQRRFVADASHELRTPVAILRGETEVTLSKADRTPEEYRETLAILRDEAQRLARIIEDLFTLTRADAGQYPLNLRDAYLDELACESLVRARSLALAKKITLCPSIEAELPIQADEVLLGRMLLNLLDNAIKYSAEGSTVQLACRREEDHYLVSVTDNGPGIPPELRAKVFERFFRVDKVRSRAEGETGGAGLGLSIARWIAEAHHGTLELSRSDASGSTFSVVLPAPAKQ